MKTLDEVLTLLQSGLDRARAEDFIARHWIRPERVATGWLFADIDIARLELIHHLMQDMNVNEEGVDIALTLLDQLYGMRAHMRKLSRAVASQPEDIQAHIITLLAEIDA